MKARHLRRSALLTLVATFLCATVVATPSPSSDASGGVPTLGAEREAPERHPLDMTVIFVIAPRATTPGSFLEELNRRTRSTYFEQTDLYAANLSAYYVVLNFDGLSGMQNENLPEPQSSGILTQSTSHGENHILHVNRKDVARLQPADYDQIIAELGTLVLENSLAARRRSLPSHGPGQTLEEFLTAVFSARAGATSSDVAAPSRSETDRTAPIGQNAVLLLHPGSVNSDIVLHELRSHAPTFGFRPVPNYSSQAGATFLIIGPGQLSERQRADLPRDIAPQPGIAVRFHGSNRIVVVTLPDRRHAAFTSEIAQRVAAALSDEATRDQEAWVPLPEARPLSDFPIRVLSPTTTQERWEFTLQWSNVPRAHLYGIQQAATLEKLLSMPNWEQSFSTGSRMPEARIQVYHPGTYYFRIRAMEDMSPPGPGSITWDYGDWSDVFAVTVAGEPDPSRTDRTVDDRDSKPKRESDPRTRSTFEVVHNQSGRSMSIHSQTTLDEIKSAFGLGANDVFIEPYSEGTRYILRIGNTETLALFSHRSAYDFQGMWFSDGVSYKGLGPGTPVRSLIAVLGRPTREGRDRELLTYDWPGIRAYVYPETLVVQRLSMWFYMP